MLVDIETSALLCYTWQLYETDVIKRIKSFTILSFAHKWLGQKTQVEACDTQSEKSLLLKLHKLLDECEIAIAHNGDSFDFKKINARFMVHKIPPPSPYVTIDTKKEFKRVSAFDSHSLNNLGIDLDEGEKIKHRGFDMWEGCMAGNPRDWRDMKRYNMQDVDLLEKVFIRLRPWIKSHPNTVHYSKEKCPRCGSTKIKNNGLAYRKSGIVQRMSCNSCLGWFLGEKLSTTSLKTLDTAYDRRYA